MAAVEADAIEGLVVLLGLGEAIGAGDPGEALWLIVVDAVVVAVLLAVAAGMSFDWLLITVTDRRIAAAMMNSKDFVFMAIE